MCFFVLCVVSAPCSSSSRLSLLTNHSPKNVTNQPIVTNQLLTTNFHQPIVTNQLPPTKCHQPSVINQLSSTNCHVITCHQPPAIHELSPPNCHQPMICLPIVFSRGSDVRPGAGWRWLVLVGLRRCAAVICVRGVQKHCVL